MDGDLLASVMSGMGMPSFGALSHINISGICATTRLLQCRDFGVYQCDISRKFDRNPGDVVDIYKEDFFARKKIVQTVDAWNEKRNEFEQFTPILWSYERDKGHLVFIDSTTTRFLLVMCFTNSKDPVNHERDYAAITKANANRFMSLAKYVYHDEDGNKPKFVRATYTTSRQGLHPDFLASFDPPANVPIFHVTGDNFIPSLLPGEVTRIDNVFAQSYTTKPPPTELKSQVMGEKEDVKPQIHALEEAMVKLPNMCSNCRKTSEKKMPTCAR
ncbi:hypothetical protein QCA50_006969 [Cerrena zonata]|uniref:Uncharacterized protein n=1 Tax=Cerrena zonata TaxID=2478898 RepID=A0AAW0GK72_9APHY